MREQSTYTGATDEGARGAHDRFGDGDQRERRAYDGPPREGRYQPPWWVRLLGTGLIVFLVLLLLGGVVTGALAILAFATPAVNATSTQSFSVAGTPSLIVRAPAASVTLVAGDASQVTLRVSKSARAISGGLARQALAAIHITVTQDGNTITIEETRQPEDFTVGFLWRTVRLDLTVPHATNLTATLNAGSLTADDLQGSAVVTANAGSIEFNNAQLSDTSLHSDAGSITLTQVALSGNAHVTANAGSIELQGTLAPHTTLNVGANAGSVSLTLPLATSAHLEATTSAGSIHIEGWPIAVQRELARSSASGDLTPDPTGSIIIQSDAGSVTVSAD